MTGAAERTAEDRAKALAAFANVLQEVRAHSSYDGLSAVLMHVADLLIADNAALHQELSDLREQLADHGMRHSLDYDPGDE